MTPEFSLPRYGDLLAAAKEGGYRFAGFDEPPAAGALILRHDVDLSLEAALALAEVEAKAGAWSTWFLMTRSVFYNLGSSEVVFGTQVADDPAYATSVRASPFHDQGHLLDGRAPAATPFRLELQNVGVDPTLCRRFGNESYCY